jgi:UDP-glucose:O-linked fucose beta-1,3-glucosyltransferase
LNILQTNIYKGNEKIESIKAEFKLETEELNEWLRVQAEKEEDIQALSKYTAEDESKEKELSLAIQKLVEQINKRKAQMAAAVTDTQVAQIELEKTTMIFKEIHRERQELIEKWESCVSEMKIRDGDINKAQEAFRDKKSENRKLQNKIKERDEIYRTQMRLNEETENNIKLSERKLARLK